MKGYYYRNYDTDCFFKSLRIGINRKDFLVSELNREKFLNSSDRNINFQTLIRFGLDNLIRQLNEDGVKVFPLKHRNAGDSYMVSDSNGRCAFYSGSRVRGKPVRQTWTCDNVFIVGEDEVPIIIKVNYGKFPRSGREIRKVVSEVVGDRMSYGIIIPNDNNGLPFPVLENTRASNFERRKGYVVRIPCNKEGSIY